MLRLLSYVLRTGIKTQTTVCPPLDDAALGLPALAEGAGCAGEECAKCAAGCPTAAIDVAAEQDGLARITLDLGACIGCGLCISSCPAGTFTRDLSTRTARSSRKALLMSSLPPPGERTAESDKLRHLPFRQALSIRVVSTGCSACDLEVGAAFNPIFDAERFGVSVVASPRAADALVVTGPVPQGMHQALLRTYEAMPEPRVVIAVGTCAISGGVHKGGYAGANGVDPVIPADIYVPGCPPHPWSIIHAFLMAMGRL